MIEQVLEETIEDSVEEQFKDLSTAEIYDDRAEILRQTRKPGLTATTQLTVDDPSAGMVTDDWWLAWSIVDPDEREDHPYIPTITPGLDVSFRGNRMFVSLGDGTIQLSHAHSSGIYADAIVSVTADRVDNIIETYATGVGAGPDDTAGAGLFITGALTEQRPSSLFREVPAAPEAGEAWAVYTDDGQEIYDGDENPDVDSLGEINAIIRTEAEE